MQQKVYELNLAGHPLRLSFLNEQTCHLLHLRPLPVETPVNFHLPLRSFETWRAALSQSYSDAYAEYCALVDPVCRYLLRYDCCLFHAVAFRWQDRAWLLTAPHHTGKTTQFLNWQRLFPGEIRMICGDMPVLEAREDGSLWVHPSAWNGRECLAGAPAAPLGGLVLLEQAQEDRIAPLSLDTDLIPLLHQFLCNPETEDEIQRIAFLMERVLSAAPAWKLFNRGGDDSTRLLRDTLLRSLP